MAWSKLAPSKRGYGSAWVKIRQAALTRDQHLCQPCLRKGRPTAAREVDHITPKAKGGTDGLDNLQSICPECHTRKTVIENGGKPQKTYGLDGWPRAE